MTNDFRNLFYSHQEAIAQHQMLQQQQQIQKPLQPLHPSQQVNHQPPVPFYPNNRFNTQMLNGNYNMPAMGPSVTASTSSVASVAADMMASHNQSLIMKNHNKENLYYGYDETPQLRVQQQFQQMQQPQQQTANSQIKFTPMNVNMCAATANAAAMTVNMSGTGREQSQSVTGSTALSASSTATASVLQNSTSKLYERRQQSTASLQYLNCNSLGYGLLSEFYEPPKPDTPPSRVS